MYCDFRKGEIDGIVFQRGVMEHIVSSNFNCRLYIVGNPFGHLQYSIMFAKDDLESVLDHNHISQDTTLFIFFENIKPAPSST